MDDISYFGHQATRHVKVRVDQAFDYLSHAPSLGEWSLGCFQVQPVTAEVVVGSSLFRTGKAYVKIEALKELGLIRFWVGSTPDQLAPRILATVFAYGEQALVSLIAYRQPDMTDERWAVLKRTHETELDLIKAQLEALHQ